MIQPAPPSRPKRLLLGAVFLTVANSVPGCIGSFISPPSRWVEVPSIPSTTPRRSPTLTRRSSSIIDDEVQPPSAAALQRKLQSQTLSRIALPSILIASACYEAFPSIATFLSTAIHDAFDGTATGYGYETLNLILTDNSNQFIQNIHNGLSLIFAFLTTNTLFFLYRQQETLYYALFDEVMALNSLLEQSSLISEGRPDMYRILLKNIDRYIEDDLKLVTDYKSIQGEDGSTVLSFLMDEMNLTREDLPALLLSRRPRDDPLEAILYATSVGEPSAIYSTIKSLRSSRSRRLAALQRKMPEVNMQLLYSLGFTVWLSFPVVTAGAITVGGDALLDVFRIQLSIGVLAMGSVLGIINELKRPEVASAYNIDYAVLGTLIRGIEDDLMIRLKKCDETIERQKRVEEEAVADGARKPWIVRRLVDRVRRRKRNN